LFYIFYGADEFSSSRAAMTLRHKLAESDPVAELNDIEIDGRTASLADLQEASDALPFMGSRRLVLVRGMLGRCEGRGGDKDARKRLGEGLKEYLPRTPPTTRLVFLEGPLSKRNTVLTWAVKWLKDQPAPGESAVIREFPAPSAGSLPRWLNEEAGSRGGELEPAAASCLADALTRDGKVDLRLADSELEKLLTFAGPQPVSESDVAMLVTPVSLESIFKLVDALGARNGPVAATLLHRYLDLDEPPLRVLALIVRQFRLLTQTRALMDANVPSNEIAGSLPVPPFVAKKLQSQARQFSMPFLKAAMRRLRDIDTEIKTGRTEPVLALDLFVASVCRGGKRA
jgi:DNA polymerase-3 subunit delta